MRTYSRGDGLFHEEGSLVRKPQSYQTLGRGLARSGLERISQYPWPEVS